MVTDSRVRIFLLQLPDLPIGQTGASGHGRLINKYTLTEKRKKQNKTKIFSPDVQAHILHYTITAQSSIIYIEEEEDDDLKQRHIAKCSSCVGTWRQAGPFPLLAVL